MPSFLEASRQMSRDCAWLRVRQASRVLTAIYDAHLEPAGVLSSQLPVLVAIARFGEREAGVSDVARGLQMDRSTLTRNLRPLERAGLVRVVRSPADARARVLILTARGVRAIETAFPLWEQAQREVREALGDRRMGDVLARLREVAALRDETRPSRGRRSTRP